MQKELFDTEIYCRNIGQKPINRADLICKILDGVGEWTNGCYKCMFDQSFLFKLALMDEEDLKNYLDNKKYKTDFTEHKGTRIHDFNIF